ncbi:MAG: hypothetical protein A3D24_00830 [Candidatus Blackburnbacteria bacterium RIFCSPHIGHO2_02_FULL_39_13]|uniref:VanZ-like domain-containing protein n=1 Tax=Candidatus Blackburnbacteria bacterium RIFCSPLOWO2_01_FULL_40_20 TaxID=1797519 RepID=A0A1G1VEB7_9BACT|nr:MAG: VanZ-like protein [Microgenomates group bacterium GW2011_GWA2_39_19]OGY06799.1 MAG: hypothetical protein A2694_00580 [Candidatus Blackburnbacteria bacterium RIFCSPHIGHO2_01_FULL_40_17]OGY09019.1 MAG: hypothetical protein A3D24_00830 [Candidatus Blackburnbacteria bacterium RIFCSPHIGHO2_02_FULL_39_13]OGY13687.1 MAG: hypothetical protein A3A77_01380 [Candidatus Blackburnbacteria bacterium RIFCSPLOWO2_01_FULL_40_20]HBL52297.1 hypothetical protein [Candidatus Blackburnbacteria bacterium]
MTKFWIPVLFWAGVIYSFSTLQVEPASTISWQDFVVKKSAHLVEYAILFLLSYRALLNTTKLSRTKSAFIAFLIALLYGASDEIHQSFTPGRGPNVRDVLIDGLGAGIAWFGLWKYLPVWPRRLKNLAKILQIS